MTLEQDNILSQTISWLRFPLIVGVVILHIDMSYESEANSVYGLFKYFLFDCVSSIAVPLFFFISGFLFFYKTSFSLDVYKKKLKRRFFSLVIPYLFWNLAFMLLTFIVQCFFPSLNNRKLICDYSMMDYLNSLWNYSGLGYGCPILAPTWFLRDLIVMVVFTPVIYFFIKYSRGYVVLLLAICYLFSIKINIVGFPRSWLFFCLGAFFSIFNYNFVTILKRYKIAMEIIGIVFLFVMLLLHAMNFSSLPVYNLYILYTIFVIITIVAQHIGNNNQCKCSFLMESSFFLYLVHGFYISPLSKLYCSIVPMNTFSNIVGYFVVAFVACTIGICAYSLLRRRFPQFTSIIVGGR